MVLKSFQEKSSVFGRIQITRSLGFAARPRVDLFNCHAHRSLEVLLQVPADNPGHVKPASSLVAYRSFGLIGRIQTKQALVNWGWYGIGLSCIGSDESEGHETPAQEHPTSN